MVASCDTIFHRTPTATPNLRARCGCSTGSRTSRLGAFPRSPIYFFFPADISSTPQVA
jgi:hypothetical protein